jgi:hypothetical protein
MSPDPAYIEALKQFGAEEPSQRDIKAIESELYNGPDRGAAVVLAALVERALEKLLRNHMRPEGASSLFKYGGPLGDFSSKIQMGYALSLFGPDTRKDLNIIRHLRNQFAHSRKPIKFTTPVVRACCEQLTYPDAPGVFTSFLLISKVSNRRLKQASNKKHPRTRYFTSCNEIAQRVFVIRGGGGADDPRNKLL